MDVTEVSRFFIVCSISLSIDVKNSMSRGGRKTYYISWQDISRIIFSSQKKLFSYEYIICNYRNLHAANQPSSNNALYNSTKTSTSNMKQHHSNDKSHPSATKKKLRRH